MWHRAPGWDSNPGPLQQGKGCSITAKIIITIILIDIVIPIIKDEYSLIQALIELWTLVFLLNKLVVFPWGADTVAWHILHNIFVCSESDSSKPKCFHTTEFALLFFPTKGCISAIFYHFFLHVFSKHTLAICNGVAEGENLQAGGAECTGYDCLVFMIEGGQNWNWN